MAILARNPVREAFSENSSGSYYYDTKGDAVHAFNLTLERFGYHLDYAECSDWYGDDGSRLVSVLDFSEDTADYGDPVGSARFSWYRVPSGRWEVIGYLT